MLRFTAGVLSALLLVTGVMFWWRSGAEAVNPLPPAPRSVAAAVGDTAPPPEASEETREQRRFNRYDKDRDGKVAREEYLTARRKAYAKLDVNGDGRLTFEEWAAKTLDKFAKADSDKSGMLAPEEFATTRVVRKATRVQDCPPAKEED